MRREQVLIIERNGRKSLNSFDCIVLAHSYIFIRNFQLLFKPIKGADCTHALDNPKVTQNYGVNVFNQGILFGKLHSIALDKRTRTTF